MPFTLYHMGPGMVVKAVLQGSFSLMIFGWTQIIIDIQPLIVLFTGSGRLHGFSHTLVGAALLAIVAAFTGRYIVNIVLQVTASYKRVKPVTWTISFISAFIGGFIHILLDAIMHVDVQPFYPFHNDNKFWQWVDVATLHTLCVYSSIFGVAIYGVIARKLLKP